MHAFVWYNHTVGAPARSDTHAEAYRSGHNEAVLKTVWVQAHGGSNPSASAKQSLCIKGVAGIIIGTEVYGPQWSDFYLTQKRDAHGNYTK